MSNMPSIDAILAEIARAAQDGQPEAAPAMIASRRRSGRLTSLLAPASEAAPGPGGGSVRERYLGEFLAGTDEQFLQSAYLAVLGRPIDPGARSSLLGALESRAATRVGVLEGLVQSDEARGRAVEIRGLDRARSFERAGRSRRFGRFLAPLLALIRLPGIVATLERRISGVDRQNRELRQDAMRCMAEVEAIATEIHDEIASLRAELDDAVGALKAGLEGAAQDAGERFARVGERLDRLDATVGAALDEANATRRKTLIEARALSELVDEAKARLPAVIAPERASAAVETLDEHALDDLYLAFENKFRGSREEISRRMGRYVPLFQELVGADAAHPVVDIGCGRGEWLSLLREKSIRGVGIDLNVTMVGEARAAGHTVVEGDAIAYLREQPSESLAAITGFHIVEHLPFRGLVRLLDEAHRTLRPGGVLLFETPNPECIVVGACNFYYDPTHQNPLPPELLRFLAEARGLSGTRIIRTDADLDLSRPESGFSPSEVVSWFQMPMDYAVFARKA